MDTRAHETIGTSLRSTDEMLIMAAIGAAASSDSGVFAAPLLDIARNPAFTRKTRSAALEALNLVGPDPSQEEPIAAIALDKGETEHDRKIALAILTNLHTGSAMGVVNIVAGRLDDPLCGVALTLLMKGDQILKDAKEKVKKQI